MLVRAALQPRAFDAKVASNEVSVDYKLFLTTLFAVFLAEMGDKTQLATLSFAASSKAKWTVFAGASLGLVAATGLAVLVGGVVSRHLPVVWMQRAAGALFVVIGLAYLLGSLRE
jgi:Ca2+/H+ antiporter, TMEM165/GDT1 family